MKYLILPGSFGSKDSNWFPWLKKELESRRHDVLLPQMPVDNEEKAFKEFNTTGKWKAKNQSLKNWIKKYEDNIKPWINNEDFIFIGHSLSPLFLLHLIEKFDLKVKAGILVSPFFERIPIDGPYDIANLTFYKKNFDWKKIRNNIKKRFVIHGDNDPFINPEISQNAIKNISAEEIIINNGGHLGSERKEFQEIIGLLSKNSLL